MQLVKDEGQWGMFQNWTTPNYILKFKKVRK